MILVNTHREFNVYLLLHFFRWLTCSFIYRNRCILWINSILWELIQYCVASMAVFNLQWTGQCWYDSIIFDVLVTNMLGIEFGYLVMQKTKVCQLYDDFTQIFYRKVAFYKSFISIWCMVILFQLQQLLMFIIFDQTFWSQMTGWLIWYRLITYSLVTMFCVNELFHWIRSDDYLKSNSLIWTVVLNFLILSEMLLAIRTYDSKYQ